MSEPKILPEDDPPSADAAARVLRNGGLVCYPTDTVYGIAAVASDDAAVKRLYAVKGRPLSKPLPLLLGETGDATLIADVTPLAKTLATRFWPGGLTIVMRKAPAYHSLALAGEDTVALRVPDNRLARGIVRNLGEPITGTSANKTNARPPVSAAEVAFQMGEMVDLIIDGGRCRGRVESTVLDITQDEPKIIREGVVSKEEIEDALGRVVRGKA